MKSSINRKISDSRLLLQNPYAYLDDVGGFSAVQVGDSDSPATMEEIYADRISLQNQYAHLNSDGYFSAIHKTSNTDQLIASSEITKKYSALLKGRRKVARRTAHEIEDIATNLQKKMWRDRDQFFASSVPNPIDLLEPSKAFRLISFEFDLVETLGQYYIDGSHVEVAGIIDNANSRVSISRRFSPNVRNFTAAHELGHALMHEATGLHRDRPLDGSNISHDAIEREADKFASCFLMPRKYVTTRFKETFGTENFALTDGTAFALTRGTSIILSQDCRSLRDLSKLLARAESYNGVRFSSLANQFHVSVETMAIRLEELGLVIW